METLFVGQCLVQLDVVDSTNSYCTEMLRVAKPVEGTVVIANEQNGGRGQRGNIWQAEPGKNLTLSFIFYPGFLDPAQQFVLNKISSLAVAATVSKLLTDTVDAPLVSIKWPNDVYVGEKKIAGILIENSLNGSSIASSIIGIGLNVNQLEFGQAAPRATSLALLSAKALDLKVCLELLCSQLEALYLQLKSGKLSFIDSQYLAILYRLELLCDYEVAGKKIKARITGIDNAGKLALTTEQGEALLCDLKEIVFLP